MALRPSERWERVQQLCDEALGLDVHVRMAWVADACGADQELRREVESLLANATKAEAFLPDVALAAAANLAVGSGSVTWTGRQIGGYQIGPQLGAGGMGEVYRARDTVLGRDVAVKVLPAAFTADKERLARFEREARVLASLNHPNIASIYGIEREGEVQALILELVEGETLDSRVRRGPQGRLAVADALGIARQIADGLEAAHEKGIVHRDLKPANIQVTAGGVVKVLDFGLAKSGAGSAPDLSKSPTLDIGATRDGMLLGTAAYMSPEQARGYSVDKRADVWGFGCVVFEMLTGRVAFPGATVSDHIAAILERDPDWSAVPEATSPAVQRLLRRCLEKDPKRRLHDIADARIEIDEALNGPGAAVVPQSRRPSVFSVLAWSLATVLVSLLTGLAVWRLAVPHRPAGDRAMTRFVVEPSAAVPLSLGLGGEGDFDISPDGTQMVYVGVRQGTRVVMLRRFDQFDAVELPGSDGAYSAFFSPDGIWVGFVVRTASGNDQLVKADTRAMSQPIVVARIDRPIDASFAWTADDWIVFGGLEKGLSRVSAGGGEPQPLTVVDDKSGEQDHHGVEYLPGGGMLLNVHERNGSFRIVAQSSGSSQRVLVENAFAGRYLPSGHLVFARGHAILAAPFDVDRLQVTGPAVTLLQQVRTTPGDGTASFRVSTNGSAVYLRERSLAGRSLVWVTPSGGETPLPIPPRPFTSPRLSPDGKRLAFALADGDRRDIWEYELSTDKLTRVTAEGDNIAPLWTPDGRRLIYTSTVDGQSRLVWQAADELGRPETLAASRELLVGGDWSHDSRTLLYSTVPPTSKSRLFSLRPRDAPKPEDVTIGTTSRQPRLSPDGRWLAFASADTGRVEVYVVAFPGFGSRHQISTEGGREPVWSADGRQLFFRSSTRMYGAPVSFSPTFAAGKPRVLFDARYMVNGTYGLDYDVAPDGRFLMVKPDEDELVPTRVSVVLNWGDELARRVPVVRR